MEKTTITLYTADEILKNWQGHRNLTRRTIEAFPEKELFEFSVGGMRPFADLVKELLAIAVPGLKQIVTSEQAPFNEKADDLKTKQDILRAWDESTTQINEWWPKISLAQFRASVNLFGQYEFPAIENIQYFIDNEIHHRAQGFVYLRVLGIQPPFFWER